MSEDFKSLLGGIRTRQLVKLVADKVTGPKAKARAEKIFILCGIKPKETKKTPDGENPVQQRSNRKDG